MSSAKRTAVTGKLSNRVMNMKFMKHAEQVEEQKEEIETTKKLVDSSEWRIEKNEKLLRKLQSRAKVVQNVGFSALRNVSENSDDSGDSTTVKKVVNPGRRIFGSKISPVIQDTAHLDDNDKKRGLDENDEDVQPSDLEKLWEAESQNKKRSTNGKKNKKLKKSSR